LLATLSGLLRLLLSGLLVLAALLAALDWIAHVNSSTELVFNAMGQSLLERISSILRKLYLRWHAKHRLTWGLSRRARRIPTAELNDITARGLDVLIA
jgi:fumarate reductase subunit D